jgi:hypothetical protein
MTTIHPEPLAAIVLALTGCAGVGKQDFACPCYPGKPLCLSASEVCRLTDGDRLPPNRRLPLLGKLIRLNR